MTEYKIQGYNDLEDIEFRLLQEIELPPAPYIKHDKLWDFLNNTDFAIPYRPILNINGFWILKKLFEEDYQMSTYILTNAPIDKSKFYIPSKKYNANNILPIDTNIFDITYLQETWDELKKIYGNEEYKIKWFFSGIINDLRRDCTNSLTKSFITDKLNELILEIEEEKHKQKAQEKVEIKKENIEKTKWEQEGYLLDKDTGVEIKDKVIIAGDIKIISEVSIKQIMGFSDRYYLRTLQDSENLTGFESTFFINKNVTYSKFQNGNLLYKIEFQSGQIFLNGVKVKRNKLAFICLRLKPSTTGEDIKIFNNLAQMKIDLLDLVEVYFDNLKIPIKVELVNDKTFKVTILGKKEDWEWYVLREMFFGGRRDISSSLQKHDIKTIQNKIKISRKDMFSKLRKIKMLQILNSENEN